MQATLELPRLELSVRLGWTDDEREHPQPVAVAILIRFRRAPAATASDQLADTLDYADLVARLVRAAAGEPYRLVERLAERLLTETVAMVGDRGSVRLAVTKYPQVDGLAGGATFTLDTATPGQPTLG